MEPSMRVQTTLGMTALILVAASAAMAAAVTRPYEGMNAFSIKCLGGKGYGLRPVVNGDAKGVLGAFLQNRPDSVAIEIQRRFVGEGGEVDNEFTELIGLSFPPALTVESDKKLELAPKVGKVAYADAVGRARASGAVNVARSRLVMTRVGDSGVLLSGSLVVERPNEAASTLQVSCVAPL